MTVPSSHKVTLQTFGVQYMRSDGRQLKKLRESEDTRNLLVYGVILTCREDII